MIAFSMFLIVTGGLGDAQHARPFARRRAGAAGELGKVVRLVQPVEGLAPAALVDQVVPLGNQIVDRAAASPTGKTARRSPCSARPCVRRCSSARLGEDFAEIADAHAADRGRAPPCGELLESGGFTHDGFSFARRTSHVRRGDRTAARLLRRAAMLVPGARACSRSASPSRTASSTSSQWSRISLGDGELRVACGAARSARAARRRLRRLSTFSSSTMPRLQSREEVVVRVPDVGDAARHAGGEVAAGRAEDHDAAAGHVLAAVVADAFDDRAARRCCGRRTARPPGRGRTPCRWSRRRARRCRR